VLGRTRAALAVRLRPHSSLELLSPARLSSPAWTGLSSSCDSREARRYTYKACVYHKRDAALVDELLFYLEISSPLKVCFTAHLITTIDPLRSACRGRAKDVKPPPYCHTLVRWERAPRLPSLHRS